MERATAAVPRVALVHDWLTGMRGGEHVLAALCRLIPAADVFTLVYAPGSVSGEIARHRIRTSFLNDLPGAGRWYRLFLPAMPAAMERMDAGGYDLIVSSSHCVANGIGGRRGGQLHVCYCHTPMRYAWSAAEAYARSVGPLAGAALRGLGRFLRAWDRRAAGRVDLFIANSRNVAGRIARFYGRRAAVVHPPVEVDYFAPGEGPREEFYLVVSAWAPYKRLEQAAEACRRLGRPLKIVGAGYADRRRRELARGRVEFLGWCNRATLRRLYRRCRALLMPGEEDFGMAAVEAISCGAPVIAYAAGGALESVRDAASGLDNPTGLLYGPQTSEALVGAIIRFERLQEVFDAGAMHRWARQFAPERFAESFKSAVEPLLRERGWQSPW